MIDPFIMPYGTDNPSELMSKFYTVGNETLLKLRDLVNSPDTRKKPRTWGPMEAAEMVGVSAPTFRKLALGKDIPGIVIEENKQKSKLKKYTLKAINHLRTLAGTKYIRSANTTPLIIAVSNLKGGVGKTQTSVDLAKKCSIEGLKVLLLDFDAQATATLISSGLIPDLELGYADTITNTLISDPSLIKEVIIHTHFDGFDLIPANLAIQDCDLILPNNKSNNEQTLGSPFKRLLNALGEIKNRYDVVLIDCGPNLGALTINALIASDGLIVPIPPSMTDYSSFTMFMGSLRNLFTQIPDKKLTYFRILLSKHNNSNEALHVENMMREQAGRYILTNHMCETVEVAKAANEVGTIYDISTPRGSREAYRRAIQHLDDVNMEIINNFKEIWSHEAKASTVNKEVLGYEQ